MVLAYNDFGVYTWYIGIGEYDISNIEDYPHAEMTEYDRIYYAIDNKIYYIHKDLIPMLVDNIVSDKILDMTGRRCELIIITTEGAYLLRLSLWYATQFCIIYHSGITRLIKIESINQNAVYFDVVIYEVGNQIYKYHKYHTTNITQPNIKFVIAALDDDYIYINNKNEILTSRTNKKWSGRILFPFYREYLNLHKIKFIDDHYVLVESLNSAIVMRQDGIIFPICLKFKIIGLRSHKNILTVHYSDNTSIMYSSGCKVNIVERGNMIIGRSLKSARNI